MYLVSNFTNKYNITQFLILGDKILPKGSSVVFFMFHTHRSAKYWPDPLKFDPDRFLPEEVAKRHPYAYVAFAAGPRNCIGKLISLSITFKIN